MSWLDLHMHSIHSDDGEFTPEELMSICFKGGVRIAAIADHNSVKGIAEAQHYAFLNGVILIPAIELDCVHEGINLHVLGYWINHNYTAYSQLEKDIIVQEHQCAEQKIALVEKLGIHLDSAKIFALARNGIVNGEIIAEVALEDERNKDNELLLPYRANNQRSDNPFVNFYWDFCSQGKPAYVPINYIDLDEAIQIIRKSGGIPVLAHPGNNTKEDEKLLNSIIQKGVVGLEVYSSYHSPVQTKFYKDFADKLGLAISCGSDFHGKTKPSISVGSANCFDSETKLLEGLLQKMK